MLARVHRLTQARIPLIGIGGVDSGAAAVAKIEAGASLVQLYTGLIFEGPGLLDRIQRELVAHLERQGLARIADAVGTRAADWAAKPVEATG
jgi:dihydroorotate dehydrogenase